MTAENVLKRPFDIKTHISTFTHYCEIIILENGEAVYAVPSHNEKLIKLYCDKHHITRNEFIEQNKHNTNWMDMCLIDLHCVLLWYDNIIYKEINDKQMSLISSLIEKNAVSDDILSMLSY